MAATTRTKVELPRRRIPRELIQMFESDPEFIHVIGDDRPNGTMVFPVDVLQKISKLNAKILQNIVENYDIVMMPKVR